MRTYVFEVDIEQEEDGSWFAEIPMLPGCALSCYPREHVLESLQEAAQMMLEVMVEHGDLLPEGIGPCEAFRAPKKPGLEIVTVTLDN